MEKDRLVLGLLLDLAVLILQLLAPADELFFALAEIGSPFLFYREFGGLAQRTGASLTRQRIASEKKKKKRKNRSGKRKEKKKKKE